MDVMSGASAATMRTKASNEMKIENDDYVVLGGAVEGEPAELTELELNLILGGYEPGYQESNPNANGWDLRGSSSNNGGGHEGAGGQGGNPYPGSDGSGGAGGGGGYDPPPPVHEPYPSAPEPPQAWDTLFINYLNRIIPSAADGAQLLRIPIITDVVIEPRPSA